MRVSLILATIGRTSEVERFLGSVARQAYRDVQVIAVDQNTDDRLAEVLSIYTREVPVFHLRSKPGLSRARNVGLHAATGDVVAFPDDDCWYPDGVLARVTGFFEEHPQFGGLSGRPAAPDGRPVGGRFDRRAGRIKRLDVWRRATSFTLFLRREVAGAVGDFDQTLGLGSGTPWGAAEDIDYPLRALELGFGLYYDPDLKIWHPAPVPDYGPAARDRAYSYACGMGRVLRKHRYPGWFVAYQLLRPVGGSFLALAQGRTAKSRFHWDKARGRLRGWLSKDGVKPSGDSPTTRYS